MSIGTGKVPNSTQIANVIPIFKSQERDDFTNYGPMALLPAFSKILERVIYKRPYNFLTLNNVLNTSQYRFRSGHSIVHAVTEFVQHVIKAIEKREYTIGIYLNLSKAFDTKINSTLLQKLEHYGIHSWHFFKMV